jgi:lantibiotic modifying enzyme
VVKLARKILSNLDHKEQKCFALEIPDSEISQVEKLERIGGLPGKQYRQKYGDYAKKLLKETIPNLFEEIPVPSEVRNDVVKEMWVQLGVQNA